MIESVLNAILIFAAVLLANLLSVFLAPRIDRSASVKRFQRALRLRPKVQIFSPSQRAARDDLLRGMPHAE